MKVSLLSKYRSCLMALAMLWVAYRHSNFPSIWKPLGFILYSCGYGGVDAFLFLSGFGIYYACKKENDYFRFIKRRLLRVLPYSIVTAFLLFLLGRKTLSNAFVEGFALVAWLRIDWIQWYTSFIVFAYLLTPLYFKVFKKNPFAVTAVSITAVWIICSFMNDRNVYIFFRFCIYFLGMLFGHINDIKPDYDFWWTIILMLLGFAWIYWLFHYRDNVTLHTKPFLLIIPGGMMLSAWIIDKIKFIQKPLEKLSKYSYQFYLVHEEVVFYLYSMYGVLYRPGIYFDYLINIAAIIIALILAVMIKYSVDYLIKKIVRD